MNIFETIDLHAEDKGDEPCSPPVDTKHEDTICCDFLYQTPLTDQEKIHENVSVTYSQPGQTTHLPKHPDSSVHHSSVASTYAGSLRTYCTVLTLSFCVEFYCTRYSHIHLGAGAHVTKYSTVQYRVSSPVKARRVFPRYVKFNSNIH